MHVNPAVGHDKLRDYNRAIFFQVCQSGCALYASALGQRSINPNIVPKLVSNVLIVSD